jgi:hypothetical protein
MNLQGDEALKGSRLLITYAHESIHGSALFLELALRYQFEKILQEGAANAFPRR